MNFRASRDNKASVVPSVLDDQADDGSVDIGGIDCVDQLATKQAPVRQRQFADGLLLRDEDRLWNGWRRFWCWCSASRLVVRSLGWRGLRTGRRWYVLVEGIALRPRGLMSDLRVVRLWLGSAPQQDKGEENLTNEQEEKQPAGGLLEDLRPYLAQIHFDSSGCCWRSARTTRTFHLLSGERLLRPPWPLPVTAKNADVIDFGGITPDASAIDCV